MTTSKCQKRVTRIVQSGDRLIMVELQCGEEDENGYVLLCADCYSEAIADASFEFQETAAFVVH